MTPPNNDSRLESYCFIPFAVDPKPPLDASRFSLILRLENTLGEEGAAGGVMAWRPDAHGMSATSTRLAPPQKGRLLREEMIGVFGRSAYGFAPA